MIGPIFWLGFALLFCAFLLWSGMLMYHWLKYGLAKRMRIAMIVYFTVPVILFFVLAGVIHNLAS